MKMFTKAFIFILISSVQVMAFAGSLASTAEVKVVLSVDHLKQTLKTLDYDIEDAEVRKIYFIDSKNLDLFDQNILLRIRSGIEDNSDITVKQRPADVDYDWSKLESEEGFKCEADINKSKNTTSCSLTEDVEDSEAQDVVTEDESIKSLFSKTQKNLIEDLEIDLTWEKVQLLGPITSTTWKVKFEGTKISAEMWKLKSGETFLEISAKGNLNEVSSLKSTLKKFIKVNSLTEDPSDISKTEFALKKLTKNKNTKN